MSATLQLLPFAGNIKNIIAQRAIERLQNCNPSLNQLRRLCTNARLRVSLIIGGSRTVNLASCLSEQQLMHCKVLAWTGLPSAGGGAG